MRSQGDVCFDDPFLTGPGRCREDFDCVREHGGRSKNGAFAGGEDVAPLDRYVIRRQSLQLVLLLGAYLPFVFFVFLVCLFTYTYHKVPVLPCAAAVICADIALVAGWPPAIASWPGRNRWDWVPLLSGLLAVGLGTGLGLVNYANIEPWVHASSLSHHANVLPDANPKVFSDAGVLHFAAGTKVDAGSAAGYRVWPYSYCAAPIVSQLGANGTVGFWAVGVGCCAGRGSFTCNDAADPEARSGLRIETHALAVTSGHQDKENFLRAVRMSAALYDLQVAEPPVLVVWSRDPNAFATRAMWTATSVVLVASFVAFIALVGCHKLLVEVWQM